MMTAKAERVPNPPSPFAVASRMLPLAVAALYIVGFIVFETHLARFGIRDTGLLKADYLKAGVLFAFIFGVVGLISFHGHRSATDDLRKSWPDAIRVFVYTAFFNFILIELLFGPAKRVVLLGLVALLAVLALLGLSRSNAVRNVGRALIFLGSVAYYAYLFIQSDQWQILLCAMTVTVAGTIFITKGQWGDKDLDWYTAGGVLIFLFVLCPAGFGRSVFGHIPYEKGGGRPVTKTLILDSEVTLQLNDAGVHGGLTPGHYDLPVVYETDNSVYVVLNDSSTAGLPSASVGIVLAKSWWPLLDRAWQPDGDPTARSDTTSAAKSP